MGGKRLVKFLACSLKKDDLHQLHFFYVPIDNDRLRMSQKKKEAEAAVELMMATVERIISEEEKRRGLLIIKALYGKFGEGPEGSDDIAIEVTIPVQCLVKDSKLILHNSSKSELPGFYDPCFGEDKQLKIEYSYRDVIQQITISDNEGLKLSPPKTNSNNNLTNDSSTSRTTS